MRQEAGSDGAWQICAGSAVTLSLQTMWEELGRALCLMLVIEGIIPFLYPARWRGLVAQLASVSDAQLRRMGLVSMLLGAGLLYLLK